MAKPCIGLLGVGCIGTMYTWILTLKVEGFIVVDAVLEKVQRAMGELDTQVCFVEDFSDSKDLDGIVLATPTDTHAHHTGAAVGLDVPIFCEEPVALDIAPVRRTNAATRSARTSTHIGPWRRFDATYAAAYEKLAAGGIGELRRVHIHTLDQAPAVREPLVASGGAFTDCLIHDFSVLRWVAGRKAEGVFTFGTDLGLLDFIGSSDVCETALTLHLTGGMPVTTRSSCFNEAGHDVYMKVRGTKGTDVIGVDKRLSVWSLEPGVVFSSNESWADFIARLATCYERELEAFLGVVVGKTEVLFMIGDTVASLHVTEVYTASCREGRPVKVTRWTSFASAIFGDDALFATSPFSMCSTAAR